RRSEGRSTPLAARSSLARSHLVQHALAQEPAGAEDEHEDQDREDDGVGPARGDVLVAPRRKEADEKTSQRRAWHVADPPEDGGGERTKARLVADVPLADVVVHPLDQPGRARESPADEEREDDGLLDVD